MAGVGILLKRDKYGQGGMISIINKRKTVMGDKAGMALTKMGVTN